MKKQLRNFLIDKEVVMNDWKFRVVGYNILSMIKMYQPSVEKHLKNKIYSTNIDGLLYIHRDLHRDNRGYFAEISRIPELEEITGNHFTMKQINHAHSKKNVARGIHAEDWNKLVFITSGRSYCALVDLRPESSTFKNVEYFQLGYGNSDLTGALYIPTGVGNSVLSIEDNLNYIYLVDRLYKDRNPKGDIAISMFDPDLSLEWPISREEMIISERDINSILLRDKFDS